MPSATLSGSALAASRRTLSISSHEMIDFESVLLDEALDAFAARAGLGACVRYRASQTYIVADDLLSRWIRKRVFDVRLLDLEVAVDVAAVVCFAPFRHLLVLHCGWCRDIIAQSLGLTRPASRIPHPAAHRSTSTTKYLPPSQNCSGSVMCRRLSLEFKRPSRPTPSANFISCAEITRRRPCRSDGSARAVSR